MTPYRAEVQELASALVETLDDLRQRERVLIGELARVRARIHAREQKQVRDPEETDRRIRALITKPMQAGGEA